LEKKVSDFKTLLKYHQKSFQDIFILRDNGYPDIIINSNISKKIVQSQEQTK